MRGAGECGCRIILSGPPGVGKTTIVKKVCNLLLQSHVQLCGFYTEEVKKNGYRVGFDVVTLNGERTRLARAPDSIESLPEPQYRVGKYVVLVKEFENIQESIFHRADENAVVVIDEIGKMEMFSNNFKQNVNNIFKSNRFIIATIPVAKGKPIQIVEEIRNDTKNTLFLIDNMNRNTMPSVIFDIIMKSNTSD